jgi:glutamine synthetase
MPKPASDRTGNGMHFHLSITDGDNPNIFHDDSDENGLGLSKTAYHFLGGLLHHAHALCAIAAPTVNSYKRLVVGGSASGATWAPAYICYGDNNRSAMVRVPYGRLEFRLADAGCNPYLVHAALIAAGLDGIEKEMMPNKPVNENLYTMTPEELIENGVGLLPQNLNEAIDALEKDTVLTDAIGAEVMAEFIKLKRDEWIDYSRHVSDWEVERYAEFF